MTIEKQANPIPQGKYVPATRCNNIVFTAGMTPRKNGVLLFTGKVKTEEPIETYRDAVRQATFNALTAASNLLKENEHIEKVLSLCVFINAEENYTSHARLADYASEYLYEELGESGIGCRAAVGMGSLPGNAPVEVQLIVMVF